MPPFLIQYGPWLFSAASCIVWFIRLESKVLSMEQIAKLRADEYKTTLDTLWKKIDELQLLATQSAISLAKIEGRLENKS